MVQFPHAKINIGLQILGKRSDGYHDLQTVFYPVALKDALEIIPAPPSSITEIEFSASGIPIPGLADENICIRAYHLLKKDFPRLPPVQMHLHKAIPIGAGLGGGSSDGAFTLKMLNEIFDLQISNSNLAGYALQLGSDCPFFIHAQPVFAQGRGEIFEDIALELSDYEIKIEIPDIQISTAKAFSELILNNSQHVDLKQALNSPPETWKEKLKNDFEASLFESYPEIAFLKEKFYQQGALYASLSGTGSAVFGIFKRS